MKTLIAALIIVVAAVLVQTLVAEQPMYRTLASEHASTTQQQGSSTPAGASADQTVAASRASSQNEPGTIEIYSASAGAMRREPLLMLSDAQWRSRLSPEQYAILRRKATEPAFTGAYWSSERSGVYRCAACGIDLFGSTTKYTSGTGWPSFWRPIHPSNITTKEDRSLGTVQIEVLCARCGGHLGHVFDDGPEPTGLRYCLNSAALVLKDSAPPDLPPEPAGCSAAPEVTVTSPGSSCSPGLPQAPVSPRSPGR